MILLNISNHPSKYWSEEQLAQAEQFGEIQDLPFPIVEPDWDTDQVKQIAMQIAHQVMNMGETNELILHIMGEMTLSYHLVLFLKSVGYTCLASTTRRETHYDQDGNKVSSFNFVRFREY